MIDYLQGLASILEKALVLFGDGFFFSKIVFFGKKNLVLFGDVFFFKEKQAYFATGPPAFSIAYRAITPLEKVGPTASGTKSQTRWSGPTN